MNKLIKIQVSTYNINLIFEFKMDTQHMYIYKDILYKYNIKKYIHNI
jgi:hypothetical protein